MPYVRQELRDRVDADIERICMTILRSELENGAGMMNYVISRIVSVDVRNNLCYTTINEAIGVRECAKLELYRRLASDYENRKCKENGDVFK